MPRFSTPFNVLCALAGTCVAVSVGIWFGYKMATQHENALRLRIHGKFAQLEHALLNYYAVEGSFPVSESQAGNNARDSWRVQVLPYADLKDVYNRIHLSAPWNGAENLKLAQEIGIPALFSLDTNEDTTDFALCRPERLMSGQPWFVYSVRADTATVMLVYTPSSTVHWLDSNDAAVEREARISKLKD